MRDEMGMERSGLETVIREAFSLLDLIQFFTAGQDKEGHTWAIPRGTRAAPRSRRDPHGHGRGFVARRVTPWDALVDAGGYSAARELRPDTRGGPGLRDAGR